MYNYKFTDVEEINKLHSQLKLNLRNDATFKTCLNSFKDWLIDLNDGLVELCEDNIKESFVNEVSIILIIIRLLEIKCGEKPRYGNIKHIIEFFDEKKFYTCYDKEIYNSIKFNDLKTEEVSFQEIIDLFPQRQILIDKKLFGQYYTPTYMVDYILSLLDMHKDVILNYKIVDPACGNGIFLIKIVDLLIKWGYSIEIICNYVNSHIFGFDINPSAVFLCKISILFKLLDYCRDDSEYQFIIENICLNNIKNINTITAHTCEKFNIILGNPPYFKIKNNSLSNRTEYDDILYGQGNIYVLFVQWSLLHIETNGDICLILPQSFRSGKYFKKIREKLCAYHLKNILCIDLKNRNQIFSEAEQAILIMHLKNQILKAKKTVINFSLNGKEVNEIGKFNQSDILSPEALILPFNNCSNEILLKIKSNFLKFKDLEEELVFGNGLFVWNQNKKYLTSSPQNNYPIIYANYIVDNNFVFKSMKNTLNTEKFRLPFCAQNDKCQRFLCKGKKLIVKRTSSMECFLRIKSCIISDDFLAKYPFYFLENHINLLYNKKDKNAEIPFNKLIYISAFLNSDVTNFIFKLTNGNTQVSATELNELPYAYEREEEIVSLMKSSKIDYDKINTIFFEIFGLTETEIQTIKNYKAGFNK